MKKLFLFLITMMLAACSAPMPGEDLGEVQQEAGTTCSITGDSGSAVLGETVITGVKIAPGYFGTHLVVTSCVVATGVCEGKVHVFSDVYWTHVNGSAWVGSIQAPLRRIVVKAPGCQLSQPTKWCMTLYGDTYWEPGHVNLLQNGNRFLSDVPIDIGAVEAPFGTGIARLAGYGSNKWQVRYPNATNTAMATKNWTFNAAACQ